MSPTTNVELLRDTMNTEMLIGSRFEAGTETEEQVLNPRTGELIRG